MNLREAPRIFDSQKERERCERIEAEFFALCNKLPKKLNNQKPKK